MPGDQCKYFRALDVLMLMFDVAYKSVPGEGKIWIKDFISIPSTISLNCWD